MDYRSNIFSKWYDSNIIAHFQSKFLRLVNNSSNKCNKNSLCLITTEKIVRAVAMTKARVYVSLDNYFTFTKYLGADPETATADGSGIDFDNYPTPKTFTVGCTITF